MQLMPFFLRYIIRISFFCVKKFQLNGNTGSGFQVFQTCRPRFFTEVLSTFFGLGRDQEDQKSQHGSHPCVGNTHFSASFQQYTPKVMQSTSTGWGWRMQISVAHLNKGTTFNCFTTLSSAWILKEPRRWGKNWICKSGDGFPFSSQIFSLP